MAVNKVVNRRTNTHAAMRNCIEYVLKEQKITDGLVYVTGPYPYDDISYDNIYNAFLEEKKLWDKDSGRMYAHNIISFHKDEKIMPEEAFEFGKEFADKWFRDFQTLIAVHQDRDHIHIHFVTNTVSYTDGYKLHTTKKDLDDMKKHTNGMCIERGLTVAEKGRHFDGTELTPGDMTTWSKDKYKLINDLDKKSYVADCAVAVLKAMEKSFSREDFISQMHEMGWHVSWTDNRKHITFENSDGKKVRDSNLSKTFNLDISKEAIEYEYTRKNESRRLQLEAEYARETEYGIDDSDLTVGDIVNQSFLSAGDERAGRNAHSGADAVQDAVYCEVWHGERPGDDTDAVIGKLEAEISTSERNRSDRNTEFRESGADRKSRDLERKRLAAAARRKYEEACRAENERCARIEQERELQLTDYLGL